MEPNIAGIPVGSIAEIVAGLAAIASVFFSVQALKTSREANRVADETRRATAKAAEVASEREAARDRRAIAASLQAWWVAIPDSMGKHEWGILVRNEGSAASLLHDVRIEVNGAELATVVINVLPPGRYFVKSNRTGWELPRVITGTDHPEPLTRSSKHSVDHITFRDQLGARWQWTPTAGVQVVDADG